jgi:hypothetical protein
MDNLLERSYSTDVNDWPVLSYSQLQSWDRCELQWHYGYKRKWTKESDHWNFGTEIHLAFKEWYSLAIDRIPKSDRFPLMEKYFSERVNKVMEENQAFLPVVSRCMWIAMRYFNEFAPIEDKGHKILAAEHHFTVPFQTQNKRNFILQGYIDLLTSKDNMLWAWDHKSSEGQFWTPTEVQMDPQLPTYCAALREQGMRVHGVLINMINSYDYKKPTEQPVDKLFRRETDYKTDRQLDTLVQEMKWTVDDLLEKYELPRRSLRRDCGNRCTFQQPCLMRMKGINDEPFLVSEFKQKETVEVELKLNPERIYKSA